MNGVQYAGAIVLVLSLLLLLLGVLKRKGVAQFQFPLGQRSSQKMMEVLERLPLTAQHSLHLIRVRGDVMLVSVSPSGCVLLREGERGAAQGLVRHE